MLRRPILVLLALGALLLTACGGAAGSDSPYSAFISGVEAASEQESVQFTLSSTSTIGGQEIEATGEGVQRLDGTAASIQVRTAFAGQSFDIDTRIVGTTFYLYSDQLVQISGSDAWVEINAEDLDEQTGLDVGQFLESAQQAQGSFDQMLGMVEEDFTEVGTEEINGVPTTHYRGTIETAKALEALGEDAGDMAAMFEGLPSEYEMDVWLDEDDLPRRVMTELDVQAEGQTIATSTTIDFVAYGVEVDVEAPEDTVRLSELMSGIRG